MRYSNPTIRIFPDIWDEGRCLEITCFLEEEAEPLAQFFADHDIKTELVSNTEAVQTMTKTK